MKKVITYGNFDFIDVEEIESLNCAKTYGDHLTVALASDELIYANGLKLNQSFNERKLILESIIFVDEVIEFNSTLESSMVKDISTNNIDIIAVEKRLKNKFDFLETYCEIKALPSIINFSKKIKIINENFK
jgi:glycerol-3-phosphate cytidylyltransferase